MRKPKGKKPKKRRGRRGNNEGSVYLGPDGRWRAVIPSKYSPTGTRHVIVGSKREGNTREAVARRLAEALAGSAHDALKPSAETVQTFLKKWLAHVESRVKPKTHESYRYTVSGMIAPHIGGVKLQSLEPRHVVFMMQKLQAAKRAPRSIAYARRVLSIALNDAKEWGVVLANVAEKVDAPRIPRAEVDAFTAEEVTRLLSKVEKPDDRLLLTTIATFGLRIGEALGLRWRDIDLDAKQLRVTHNVQRQVGKGIVITDAKTDRSRRALMIPEALCTQLREHRKRQREERLKRADLWEDHDFVFPTSIGTPQESRNVLRVLHAAERKAKLPKKGLHKLRSSAATILLTSGVPLDVVSDMLGHASTAFTHKTYVQFVMQRQEGAAAVMNDLISKVKPPKAEPKPKA